MVMCERILSAAMVRVGFAKNQFGPEWIGAGTVVSEDDGKSYPKRSAEKQQPFNLVLFEGGFDDGRIGLYVADNVLTFALIFT